MKRPRTEEDEEASAATPGLSRGGRAVPLASTSSHAEADPRPMHHQDQGQHHGPRQRHAHFAAHVQDQPVPLAAGSLAPSDMQVASGVGPSSSQQQQATEQRGSGSSGALVPPAGAGCRALDRVALSAPQVRSCARSTPPSSSNASPGSNEQTAPHTTTGNNSSDSHLPRPTSHSPPPVMSSGKTDAHNAIVNRPSRHAPHADANVLGGSHSSHVACPSGVALPPELQAKLRKKIRIIQPISSTWEADTLLLATPGNGTSRSNGGRGPGKSQDGPAATPPSQDVSEPEPRGRDQGRGGSGSGGSGSGTGASGSDGSRSGDAAVQPRNSNTPPSSAETSPTNGADAATDTRVRQTAEGAGRHVKAAGHGKSSSQDKQVQAQTRSPHAAVAEAGAAAAGGEAGLPEPVAPQAPSPGVKHARSLTPHAPPSSLSNASWLTELRPPVVPGRTSGWLVAGDPSSLACLPPHVSGMSWLLPGQEVLQPHLLSPRMPPVPASSPAVRLAQAMASGAAGVPSSNGLPGAPEPPPRPPVSPTLNPLHHPVLPGTASASEALADVQGQLGVLYQWYVSNRNSYLDQTKSYLAGLDQVLQQQAQQQWGAGSTPVGVMAVNQAIQAAMQIIKASTEVEGSWRTAATETQQPS